MKKVETFTHTIFPFFYPFLHDIDFITATTSTTASRDTYSSSSSSSSRGRPRPRPRPRCCLQISLISA